MKRILLAAVATAALSIMPALADDDYVVPDDNAATQGDVDQAEPPVTEEAPAGAYDPSVSPDEDGVIIDRGASGASSGESGTADTDDTPDQD